MGKWHKVTGTDIKAEYWFDLSKLHSVLLCDNDISIRMDNCSFEFSHTKTEYSSRNIISKEDFDNLKKVIMEQANG